MSSVADSVFTLYLTTRCSSAAEGSNSSGGAESHESAMTGGGGVMVGTDSM